MSDFRPERLPSSSADSSASPADDITGLRPWIESLGLDSQISHPEMLARYATKLWEWNRRVNLTRHLDWEAFACRDLLDSVCLAQAIPEESSVLDFGSGGGVPGIPIAVMRGDLRVSLCDSVGRKANALRDIVDTLGLSIPVYAERVETVLRNHQYDVLTARAVASVSRILEWLLPVRTSFRELLLIKGPRWKEEYEEAALNGRLKHFKIEQLSSWMTPGRDGASVLLRVTSH